MLDSWGMNIVFEGPGIKDWDCVGTQAADYTIRVLDNVFELFFSASGLPNAGVVNSAEQIAPLNLSSPVLLDLDGSLVFE